MRLATIHEGDIVEVTKTGAEFCAFVTGKEAGLLRIRPICRTTAKWRPVTASVAKPREVTGHWRRRAGVTPHA
jgi:hypothetical protein